MNAKIAVATVSGKAYYHLVNELKARGLPFLSLHACMLNNGNVLETMIHSSVEQIVNAVLDVLTKNPAAKYIVKVGDGAPEYTRVLLSQLDEALPKDVEIEIVSEAGTSRFAKETVHRRGLRDAMSAVKIAERRGRPFHRGKGKQQ
jgi:hypothetical protein